ncbi:GNAT family N-acetyltransferase [Dictyobacter aurantiacus]|uniref:N-acetyltransferase domain-containing protein n=1 Tax=Dictyobacter aurantiacus TaxID=1936993 RepID=A0A401ZQ26_9CHLR|nr:GNAT family N-acetyltransferase [Dictyobacter aurantiacus]GCE08975.1 hypothetical protein KDAU_63040 [Dictyobacter aurantiacus]
MTVTIRTLCDTDVDAADAVIVAAYNAPHSRKAALQAYLRLQPDGWMLALQDNEPVGLGGLVNYGPFAYLGMMSVLPAAQGKGIGKQLVSHLLQWAENKKCPTILLDATPAGSYLYKSFDFVEIDRSQHWQHAGVDELTMPSQTNGIVTAISVSDLPSLAAFDTPYFGASRIHVLEAMLGQYPRRAFAVWDTNGQVNGYLFAQERSIGPWVARSMEDAERLLAAALKLPFPGNAISVNISSITNQDAIQLLERYGFKLQRTLSHMRRGPAVERNLRKIYGQTAFALG